MSNVTVTASDETGLEVDVVLGANVRKTHQVPGGESVELTVGGGQVLSVRAASNVAPTADLPVGVDVSEDDEEVVISDEEAQATLDSCLEDAASEPSVEDLGAELFADQPDEGRQRNPALADQA